jgi:hypothetical protein
MNFRVVPRITATLHLVPRRPTDASSFFLWGVGIGAVATLALAATAVRQLARKADASPRPERAADGGRVAVAESASA